MKLKEGRVSGGEAPRSATALTTGFAGLAAAVAAFFLLQAVALPTFARALIVVCATAAAMILTDSVLFKTWRNSSTGLSQSPLRPASIERTARKLIGLWGTIGTVAFAYWLFIEYSTDFYAPFRSAVTLTIPLIAIFSPFYVIYVDRRQVEPEDAYAQIGAMVVNGTVPQWSIISQHVRGWIVKGFFLPLMFVFINNDLEGLWRHLAEGGPSDFRRWYEVLFETLFLVDVLFAGVGYIFTFRVLDTHIRSTEPTMLGWVVCLMCYQPFWNIFDQSYLRYEADRLYWGDLLSGWQPGYVVWGSVILLLNAIYAWSTVAFGLRFSNLTHRGIITNGPYRWLKHPAYVSKNLSWWLISIPLLSNAGWEATVKQSLLLLCLNGVYALRAYTEERHLSLDPDYRAYREFMRERGLVAVLRRALSRRPRPS